MTLKQIIETVGDDLNRNVEVILTTLGNCTTDIIGVLVKDNSVVLVPNASLTLGSKEDK